MKRPVGLQNDRELFRLAVAEIAHAPERSRNLPGVDGVDSRNTDALPQIFVCIWVSIIDEHDGAIVRIWIDATLAYDLIGARTSRSRVDRQLQVIANGLRLEPPRQPAANQQADSKESDHAGREGVVTA